jgi:hypothetical protein
MGLPRIGKSSLAQQAIIEYQKEHPQENIIPVWINMGDYMDAASFFERMLDLIHYKVAQKQHIDLTTIQFVYEQATDARWSFSKKQMFIFRYYCALKDNIFVLYSFWTNLMRFVIIFK